MLMYNEIILKNTIVINLIIKILSNDWTSDVNKIPNKVAIKSKLKLLKYSAINLYCVLFHLIFIVGQYILLLLNSS